MVDAMKDNIDETTSEIEQDIKAEIWSSDIPVNVTEEKELLSFVRVGNRNRFYSGFLEFGTAQQPPQPVVVPAGERQERPFRSRAAHLERETRKP
jgi:HK97 gp10 family phage protein